MSELSPAAQAVAKAALYVSSCDPEEYPHQAQEIAAAALRAVAKQSIFADTRVGVTDKVVLVDTILAIAAELEGADG